MASIPYGLRDVKITPYTDGAGTILASSSIDLPYSQTFSFSEAEEFQEMRGDDQVIATVGKGPAVSWELAAGGLSLEAVQAVIGGTVTTTGVAPNQVHTFLKKADDIRPYFQVEGQVITDGGGDLHAVVFRCRMTGEFSGEFADGEFFTTGLSGTGLPSLVAGKEGDLYEFVQNPTATAITP